MKPPEFGSPIRQIHVYSTDRVDWNDFSHWFAMSHQSDFDASCFDVANDFREVFLGFCEREFAFNGHNDQYFTYYITKINPFNSGS